MKKTLFVMFIFVHTGFQYLCAQNWQPVGRGAGYGEVRGLYADTIANRLYVGGTFTHVFGYSAADSVRVNGIGYWDGSNWFGLGGGDTSCNYFLCNSYVRAITRYEGDIYAGGNFTTMGGTPNTQGLARWDGSGWNAVGGDNIITTSGNHGAVFSLKEINGKLYVQGAFDSLSGIEAHGVATWDGSIFNDVYNFPNNNPGSNPNYIVAVDSFQGEFFAGGVFEDASISSIKDISRWDGIQWQSLQGGILGGFGAVNDMVVYKNELYVAGSIRKVDGNAGDGVMVWNGSSWREFSPDVYFGGQIFDLDVIDNTLYIVGGFLFVGDTTQYGMSKYDGTTFSAFGGPNAWAYSIAGLNGNIYVATDQVIAGDTVNYIAQWMGGSLVDSSITVLAGVNEVENITDFEIYPNPTQSQITIESNSSEKQNAIIEIKNILGQTIYTDKLKPSEQKKQIDLTTFPPGVYIVQLQSENGVVSKKFIKN